jgi:FG-GAP-like repeat
VFEDLEPRLADIDGNGHDDVAVVKSYLKRGSSLAIIAERRDRYQIIAETPPLGAAHRWLDPTAIGDFTGDGKVSIALVRQPHVIGMLELWTWSNGTLHKSGEITDSPNHIAGTSAIGMSAVADFNDDGVPDIALPSLDRKQLRIVSFAPQPHEIASVPLPAKAQTNIGLMHDGTALVIVVGLSDGSIAVLRQQAQ